MEYAKGHFRVAHTVFVIAKMIWVLFVFSKAFLHRETARIFIKLRAVSAEMNSINSSKLLEPAAVSINTHIRGQRLSFHHKILIVS
ncbi:uncharacterized protein CLUP02_04892 [Colletotrichum lupini]|uniref:Uncharacterized protein n=1 Tax=Colletotrichum lupini TaxID=145971 RepID=A0A9Q8SMY2_9PEZI|nr:uncharacterized protein CLUP02_04892 [Colletotrichum lupini]UQC79412.1 hypothetical protein CLUP02_04892 [Colletotrichum lupini]